MVVPWPFFQKRVKAVGYPLKPSYSFLNKGKSHDGTNAILFSVGGLGMSDLITSCVTFVKSLLLSWPKKNNANIECVMKSMSNSLSQNFDESDLLIGISGIGEVVNTILLSESMVIVEFNDTEGYLYRAKVIKDSSNKMLLEYVKFQCPSCFGSGINDGDECYICGGVGWGLSEIFNI